MTTATANRPSTPTPRHAPVRAPRGSQITCKNWLTEAAMRMIMNNLDPDVAERPDDLVVYGGSGKAARTWEDFERIVATLKRLEADETMLVQSGRAVGVVKTHPDAPRVLIANANLVPHWGNWNEFRRLEALGLTMYGQMTAGSWIYIGTQGILQGTYETFGACARQHFGGSLAGRWVLTGGLGGMGGAQPLAATMNGAAFVGVDVDRRRIEKRIHDRYLDRWTESLDEALGWVHNAKNNRRALSVGLLGNCADVLPELVKRGVTPDVLTDQTSAHDALDGYVPNGLSDEATKPRSHEGSEEPRCFIPLTFEQALQLRGDDPARYQRESFRSMAEHVQAMLVMQERGAVAFDYGNNLRGQAVEAVRRGLAPWTVQQSGEHRSGRASSQSAICNLQSAIDFDPFRIPGFVPEYIRPLFCEGQGPFRWVALSGDPKDIVRTDRAVLETFPHNDHLCRWIKLAGEKVAFQGLPARICWLGYGERAKMGLVFNELVRTGEVSAPIVIGRDHLDCGSVASPNRETEAMKDGSDAIADWPILNALLNTACGATWVSFHHGGGVGIGYSLHAGQVIVADGTPAAARRLERVLTADPAMGIFRHVDAGYERAREVAEERGVNVPI